MTEMGRKLPLANAELTAKSSSNWFQYPRLAGCLLGRHWSYILTNGRQFAVTGGLA